MRNYPNPFSGATIIDYRLSSGFHVCIEVFNQSGQQVEILVNEYREKRDHKVSFLDVITQLPADVQDIYAKAFEQNYFCFDLYIFSSVDFGLS